jgi:hypothetical protein
MSLSKTIEVVTKLAEQGVIERYAIAGAVAALNYIEPTLTEDLDILVIICTFRAAPIGSDLAHPDRKGRD